ncbi:MAG: hypothetical protein KDD11_08220, partial [Acidobacteria bacterium]|nr:hypothetical protein [Acidobacteriota bacterium]
WDAAGKGGAIRRLTRAMDARSYIVIPVAAPTDEEHRYHYLWRFWRRLEAPRDKQILIFDRSWYGRVLVERVEGFAREAEWRRAYGEINGFERQLVDHGTLLAKFWFHIAPQEQLERFEARREIAYKQWKLTEEDWRNREKWPLYEAAVEEMLARTSPPEAPWTLISGNDKLHARVATLRRVIEVVEQGLGPRQR